MNPGLVEVASPADIVTSAEAKVISKKNFNSPKKLTAKLAALLFQKILFFICDIAQAFNKFINAGVAFDHRFNKTAPNIQHDNAGVFCIVQRL